MFVSRFGRTVKDSSVVAVQVFDQRKFKRKDQGFLGVINLKVADVIDLDSGGQGESRDTCTRMMDGLADQLIR